MTLKRPFFTNQFWVLAIALGLVACSESGTLDASVVDSSMDTADTAEALDAGADQPDAPVDIVVAMDTADVPLAPSPTVRGQFESTTALRSCGEVQDTWQAPDGFLLKVSMDLCGDDLAALSDTVVANLDAAAARGGRVLLIFNQGLALPEAWVSECETFELSSPGFNGESCLPWDASYQSNLSALLNDRIGPAVADHAALEAVYFTTTTMTNGAEMHFRVARDDFDPMHDEARFRQSYLDVMDIYQEAFGVPILFEAGHCIFDLPGGPEEGVDCETPLALYRHARDEYGLDQVGLALWNCAERFWYGPGSDEDGTRALLEEATADGVSMGCQTVGNFTNQPCRFSHDEVGDYGMSVGTGRDLTCIPAGPNDAANACVDTLAWFAGTARRSEPSVALNGTWLESWTADARPDGAAGDAACAAAASVFALD